MPHIYPLQTQTPQIFPPIPDPKNDQRFHLESTVNAGFRLLRALTVLSQLRKLSLSTLIVPPSPRTNAAPPVSRVPKLADRTPQHHQGFKFANPHPHPCILQVPQTPPLNRDHHSKRHETDLYFVTARKSDETMMRNKRPDLTRKDRSKTLSSTHFITSRTDLVRI